jgi:hypothetical protein
MRLLLVVFGPLVIGAELLVMAHFAGDPMTQIALTWVALTLITWSFYSVMMSVVRSVAI